jgi:hypothetical protein
VAVCRSPITGRGVKKLVILVALRCSWSTGLCPARVPLLRERVAHSPVYPRSIKPPPTEDGLIVHTQQKVVCNSLIPLSMRHNKMSCQRFAGGVAAKKHADNGEREENISPPERIGPPSIGQGMCDDWRLTSHG